jgi:hypothetical protein
MLHVQPSVLSRVTVTLEGVLDWILVVLTTCTHHSKLQAITTPPLITAIHKSPQPLLSLFQPAVFTSRSLIRLLTVEIFFGFGAQVLSSQPPVQNWYGRSSFLPYNSSELPAETTPFILLC